MASPALLSWVRSFDSRLSSSAGGSPSSPSQTAPSAFAAAFKGFSAKDEASVTRLLTRVGACDDRPLGELLLRVARDVCGIPEGGSDDGGVACLKDCTR